MFVNSADDFINPPGVGDRRRADQESEERQIRTAADLQQNPRQWHSHLGPGLERLSGPTPGRAAKPSH